MDRPWRRDEAIEQIWEDLHRYLSAAASHAKPQVVLDHLLALPEGHRRRALAIHLLTSSSVATAVEAMEVALARLTPRSARRVEETRGYVAGPVSWPQTLQRRLSTADPTLFVARPAHRHYDTSTARFLVQVGQLLLSLHHAAELDGRSSLGASADKIGERVKAVLNSKKLTGTRPLGISQKATVARLAERTPSLKPIAEVAAATKAVLHGGEVGDLLQGLLDGVLAPTDDARLFELWVGFRMLHAFAEAGMEVRPFVIEPGGGQRLFAEVRLGQRSWEMAWQRSVWSMSEISGDGAYVQALSSAGLSRSALLPDFILSEKGPNGRKVSLIEVKHSVWNETVDREGLRDSLAYTQDLQEAIGIIQPVRCLIVGSTSSASPGTGQYMLCGPTSIGAASFDLLINS